MNLGESFLLVFMIGISFILFICVSILGLLTPFILWTIFKKAGEKGWKSLIPVYDMAILNKIVGISPWFAILSQIAFICAVTSHHGNLLGLLCRDYSFIILFSMDVYVSYKLSKAFGKKGSYAIGMIFLPFIFYPKLVLGESKYIGTNGGESQDTQNSNDNVSKKKKVKIFIYILIIELCLLVSLLEISSFKRDMIRRSQVVEPVSIHYFLA